MGLRKGGWKFTHFTSPGSAPEKRESVWIEKTRLVRHISAVCLIHQTYSVHTTSENFWKRNNYRSFTSLSWFHRRRPKTFVFEIFFFHRKIKASVFKFLGLPRCKTCEVFLCVVVIVRALIKVLLCWLLCFTSLVSVSGSYTVDEPKPIPFLFQAFGKGKESAATQATFGLNTVFHNLRFRDLRFNLMAVFTLEDEQIVWMDKIVSDKQIVWCENGTNKFFDEQIVWYLAVWKDDSSQTICPSRRTSRRQYDINSHQTDKCQTIRSSSSVKTANFVGVVWTAPKMYVHYSERNHELNYSDKPGIQGLSVIPATRLTLLIISSSGFSPNKLGFGFFCSILRSLSWTSTWNWGPWRYSARPPLSNVPRRTTFTSSQKTLLPWSRPTLSWMGCL